MVPMPKLGAGVYKEGVILKWFKREGDPVKEREPIAEIETEKAVVSYESPVSGVVLKLIVPEGSTVLVGEPVCVVGEIGEDIPPVTVRKPPEVLPAAGPASGMPVALTPGLQVSPAARRLAETMGVDLNSVVGTGTGGMIMREDVLKVARAPKQLQPQVGEKLVGMSTMRTTIAQRLLKSQHDTAHVTLHREVEAKHLVSLVKEKLKDSGVSYTDVLVKVAAEALKEHPIVNSRLEGDKIRLVADININVAVAVESGLIAPTLRNADRLSLSDVSHLLKNLSEKARLRTLTSVDYADGTFTISNLGMFGIDGFTPIINPPQVAILGTGRVLERPWVANGQVEPLPTMVLSLTFDHRVVDGADAARFLDTIASLLENLTWLV